MMSNSKEVMVMFPFPPISINSPSRVFYYHPYRCPVNHRTGREGSGG